MDCLKQSKSCKQHQQRCCCCFFFWKGLSQFKEVYTRKKTPTRSCFLKYKQRSGAFGLGQTSNFSWEEPNSNLDRTILTFWVRRQTQDASNQSTESDQKEILIHFHPNEAKFTLSNKFLIISSVPSSHVKINVCPGDDFQTFYLSEADGQNVLDDELHSLSLVRLTKSSKFGRGLAPPSPPWYPS